MKEDNTQSSERFRRSYNNGEMPPNTYDPASNTIPQVLRTFFLVLGVAMMFLLGQATYLILQRFITK